jgi:protease-4
MLAIVLVVAGIINGMASSVVDSKKETVSVTSGSVLKIDFSSALAEQDDEDPVAGISPVGGSSRESMGILKAVSAVRIAADDPAIKFIYVNTDNMAGGLAEIEELRDALQYFRNSGKPVVSYAENYTNAGYYLASVSDRILMNRFGDCAMIGLSSNMMFYKDLLDKLGIKAQLIRHGKYKSAGEPYIANDISDANREMSQSMLNSVWNSMLEEISVSRDIPVDTLNAYIDGLELLDAESMLKRGLIDSIAYRDGLENYLCMLAGVNKVSELKVVPIEDYAVARVRRGLGSKEKIAVIYANGEINSGDEDKEITDGNFTKIIRRVRADSSVKAVVFRVNSPGGSAQAAENIRREISLLKEVKPVVASYGSYAASGGYWISAGCDSIFTDNVTLTGSIGVFALLPCAKDLLNKHAHINNVVISTNKHGAMGNFFSPLDKDETSFLQHGVELIYDRFLNIVSEGRDMSVARVDSIAQGRVWTGSQALENGIADSEGGIYDAIDCAAGMAGLPSYRIEEYPVPKNAMEKLMEFFNRGRSSDEAAIISALRYGFSSSGNADSEIRHAIADPLSFFTAPDGMYARMDYVYDIK